MLAVPQDQQSKLTALTNVLEKLQQQGMMSRVSSIDLTHVSCMVLRLDGSIDAKLPLTGDTAYYLRALNAAVEEENRRPRRSGGGYHGSHAKGVYRHLYSG